MKSLELTEEHKIKLLEMCHTLFPEMDAYTIQCTEESSGMILGTWGQSTDGIAIHWFEFCITTLATKIWNKSYDIRLKWGSITMFRGILCQEVNHTVDYLYGQFKKINNDRRTF